eukprot:GHVH01005939.1.p1 GENE.GHVH01005939.1~~GHVH01005939.1.p1  ORF type:complete len:101 (-),score=9.94 GHVH01005939.1:40-342(-)
MPVGAVPRDPYNFNQYDKENEALNPPHYSGPQSYSTYGQSHTPQRFQKNTTVAPKYGQTVTQRQRKPLMKGGTNPPVENNGRFMGGPPPRTKKGGMAFNI